MNGLTTEEWASRVKVGRLFANDQQPYFDPGLRDRLASVRVQPKAEFAVPQHVWELVVLEPTLVETRGTAQHLVCALCGQSCAVLAQGGAPYRYAYGELAGLRLAHLIQAHQWTREGPPTPEAGHG